MYKLLLVLACGLAAAQDDAALEKRVRELSTELRCLVCQNQTLADSNADLAVDLREQVRTLLRQGQSEKQIIDYMTARYGDFVLYRPPFKVATLLLWLGPFLFLALGLYFLVRKIKMRKVEESPLSDEEHARAAALLDAKRE